MPADALLLCAMMVANCDEEYVRKNGFLFTEIPAWAGHKVQRAKTNDAFFQGEKYTFPQR